MTGAVLALLAAVLYVASPAHASSIDASSSAAQRLAAEYAPIVVVRAQHDGVCDISEEQYAPPTSVNLVLGNPRVTLLMHTARGTRLLKRAPTAADIAGQGNDVYLNLPGSPLNPGCTFARDFAALKRAGRAPAVTYAHIAREPGHAGFALQYWFYYYFNQFNDLHESDWEGMQLAFNADTPAQALNGGSPYEIVVFQHSGGEHADWDSSKVQRRGTHPVVFSAAGSHATFYGSALYLGNGQNGSGVGCDNTTTPLTTVTPRPILLPDVPTAHGAFAWLSFTGRWGQREAGFNNGPTGPNTKTVWREPFTWMDGTRSTSPKVPAAAFVGPSVAGAFCGVVANVSSFLNLAAKTVPGAIGVAVIVLVLILVPASLTTWRPVSLDPLRQVRALGQLLMSAGRLYWRHAAILVLIALTSLLLIGAVDGLEWLVTRALRGSGGGSAVTFGDSGTAQGLSVSAGIGHLLSTPIASGAVIAFVRSVERGQPAGFASTWRAVLGRLWRLIAVELLATLLVILLLITIIGIPYAIHKFVDWQFAQQEVLFEDRSIRDALRSSSRIVHGHWWHTGVVAATFFVLGQIPGPLLGFALLFTTTPVASVNLFGSMISALLLPYVGVGRTLLYLDLEARHVTDAAPAPLNVAPAPAAG